MNADREIYEDVCELREGTDGYEAQMRIHSSEAVLRELTETYIKGGITYRRFKKLLSKHTMEAQSSWESLREFAGVAERTPIRISRSVKGVVFLQAVSTDE